jgi:hypothetical protein
VPFLGDTYPSYMVWGALVFSTLTEDHLKQFESEDPGEAWFSYLFRNQSPILARDFRNPRFPGEELVVVVAMLEHPLVKGYNDPAYSVVDEVNGVKIRNLRHLAEQLRDAKDEYIVISFGDRYPDVFVFDRKEVLNASEDVLTENGIRKAYSDDLKPVFESKRPR